MKGYDLAICGGCGAGYSDAIPPQNIFDRYYEEMSKYERGHFDGAINQIDADRYRHVADSLAPHLKPQDSLADIGCATGALLAEFKRRGFNNLLGIDPSPACTDAGKRLYGIDMRPMTIGRLHEVTERFDAVILGGVLEHLCDVDASLALVTGILKPGGRLYIEVPDATRYHHWFSAPYQFLSMEHVNFFSPLSLSNLMARHGLRPAFVNRVTRWLGPTAVEPAIAGLFQRSEDTAFTFDAETEPTLRAYLDVSSKLESRIQSVIDELVEHRTPIAVWGAGTHTLRLLETSSLANANILAFLDSNSRYQGKKLRGIPIVAPNEWTAPTTTILISSHVAEQEIKRQITEVLKWPNPIVCLYEGSPLELAGMEPKRA